MTKYIGRLGSVGIGREAVRGTAVAPQYWLQLLDYSIDDKVTTVLNESSVGVINDSDGMAIVQKWGELTASGKIKDESIGLLLLATLGAVSSSVKAGETVVYDHVFTVDNSNQHIALTLAHKSPNDDVRFALGMIENLAIDIPVDNYPTFEVTFMSKPSTSASNTVAHSVERDFLPRQVTFKKASTQAGLNAAPTASIRSANLEISKNLNMIYNLGSDEPTDIPNQQFTVTGSITVINEDSTYSDLQNNETDQAFRFSFTNPVTIGVNSNPTLQIDLYKVRIQNYSKSIGNNDIVEESFDFVGHYSLSDAKSVEITLTNEVANYNEA